MVHKYKYTRPSTPKETVAYMTSLQEV